MGGCSLAKGSLICVTKGEARKANIDQSHVDDG
jgi:hypothetical protein